ncbi:hypothetical protein HQ489_06175 [Candidatus Woesearchaeota archaeon]|nr:hypothetical protein [Candidatus Woesearchaeota archaeon]
MERPTGVTVFAVLEILAGLFSLVGGLFVFLGVAALSFLGDAFGATTSISGDVWLVTSTMLGITLGLLSLIGGIGLFIMKKWSRFLIMTVAVFTLIVGLISLIMSFIESGLGGILSIFGFVITLVYNGLLLWYFRKEDIHHHFDNQHEEQKAEAGEEVSQVEINQEETIHQQ